MPGSGRPLKPDDPVLAVVSPPRIDRFRQLAGLAEGDRVTADFGGWSKLVLLTPDQAILFPRDHKMVEPLRWEVDALRAVAPARLPEIPEVLHVWEDAGIGPYPVVALNRLPGTSLENVLEDLDSDTLGNVFEQLGALTARWHSIPTQALPPRPARKQPHREAVDLLLGVHREAPEVEKAVEKVGVALGLDATTRRLGASAIRRVRSLGPVIAHGDVHEAQILVDPDAGFRVSGILDWQTATVDHPFTDFDLGQWGPTIWRRHRDAFPTFRHRWWTAYAAGRRLPADLGPALEWLWTISHAFWLVSDAPDRAGPDVVGTLDEALAHVAESTSALGE